MNNIPATIDLNPEGGAPEASIIWLHGLGADANDFVPMAEQFDLLKKLKIRFVFPYAPVRAITVNSGMKMRGWYDIFDLSISRKEDEQGIKDSHRLVSLLIAREESLGIPSNKILLGGFSQGAAIALYLGLRHPKKLGGIIALSGYLPLPITLKEEGIKPINTPPIFMAHGLYDPVVPLMLAEMSKEQLEGLGYKIDWHSYPMPHTVLPEEIKDIDKFIANILISKK